MTRIESTREYIEDYAEEELVAEMTAFMVTAELGFEPNMANSINYVAGWKRRIHDDPNVLFRSATNATAAVQLIQETRLAYEAAKLASVSRPEPFAPVKSLSLA